MMIVQTYKQKQYLKELMTLTLINILNAKGAIYWHYKNKQGEENNDTRKNNNAPIRARSG